MAGAEHLKKVVKEGGVFSGGALLGTGLQFIFGVLVIRLLTQQEYGLIAIGYLVANILAIMATAGFGAALPRFIASRKSRETQSIGTVIGTALVFCVVVSGFLSSLAYAAASSLAAIFGKPPAVHVLQAFALLIPPIALTGVLSALFRADGAAKPNVLFNNLGLNLLRLLLLLPVAILHSGVDGVIMAYVGSVWLATASYFAYARRRLFARYRLSFRLATVLELLSFSLPLLGVDITANAMAWTGTITLGYFQSSQEVALYNAPLRLVNFVPLALTSLAFLYLPVATRLIRDQRRGDLGALYRSTTKWAFMITLPAVLYLLVAARPLSVALFGPEYAPAAAVLQVLAVGQAIHTLLGPNGMTLVACGESRPVFTATVLGAVVAISLCFALVPAQGALGAAWAAAAANGVSNGYISLLLKRRYGIHPFGADYVKPLLFAGIVGSVVGWGLFTTLGPDYWVHGVTIALLIVICLAAPVLTGSMTAADVEVVAAMERRFLSRSRLAVWLRRRCVAGGAGTTPLSPGDGS